MTTSAPRAPIDFDALERDLHQAPSPQPESLSLSRSDPLAELARIVGQDDPFRALLASRGAAPAEAPAEAPAKGSRVEPTFFDAPAPAHSPADAFDQYLATVEQGAYADDGGHAQQDPAAFDDSGAGYRAAVAKRPRRQLLQVGSGLGVLVLCVTGALGWKVTHSRSSNGEPVTVLADKSPLKVAPQANDGVEIPDQNKQIYERGAKDGQIKVVNREEQPLDVTQAARSAAPPGNTTPGNTAMLSDSLGQPRRVRTVSVKPDTPVTAASQAQAQPQRAASADSVGPAPTSPIPTMMMPDGSEGAASRTPAASPRRPARTVASANVPATPVQVADASGSSQPTPGSPSGTDAAAVPAPRKTPQRVASIAPETTASTSASVAPASTASTASVGGFSVQIGVSSSEADARSVFRKMQTKYSQLSGKPELIRQAEVGGKSIYRVRVGPLAKNEATSLCTDLKGAGGQCFVAKN